MEYFSGLDAGGGYRCAEAIGRPLDISGLTATTLPVNQSYLPNTGIYTLRTEFLPETLGAKVVQSGLCGLLASHDEYDCRF